MSTLRRPKHIRELNTYQQLASETAMYPGRGEVGNWSALMYPFLKLNGEAGELAELIGKAYRKGQEQLTPEQLQAAKLELGDVLWYVSEGAEILGFTLEDVAEANLNKLSARSEAGTITSTEKRE